MTTKRRTRGSGAIERLPSGRYRVRWWTLDGRHPSRTFTLKQDAETWLRRVLVDQEREGYDLPSKSLTVATLTEAWWETVGHSVKPRTLERYEDHRDVITRMLGDVPVGALDYDRVQRFVNDLRAVPYAPKTIRGIYGVLGLILAHASRSGKIHKAIPRPTLPRVERPLLTIPTRHQVEQLAVASDARLWAPVILAGYCGLREGEMLALLREDVHLDESAPWLLVRHARNKTSGATESTKTERIRRVYLPARVVEAVDQHLTEYAGELVVPASASVLQKSWERSRHKCGLDAVRFHDLRHAAASMMIAAGLNVLQVSKQLGHATPTQTLNTYGHLFPDDMSSAISRMDEYLAA